MQLYVVTVSSEKGGVGKTTLATNLAIYLKALCEELPVTLVSFDNHFSVDRMFRIGPRRSAADVRGLFTGRDPGELLETGEFGIQFIPSSRELETLRGTIAGPGALASNLAESDLQGILVIDTRPDLDIFTQNALFAADRVIIPVKDTPSLENCRYLYEFFDQQGLSRRSLRVLPCLIDSRIRFKGPFRDAYRLLKGYAINRGYRCMEGYVAKSPKVESLNTNPDGRIYPVLTHGRGTEVHYQFTRLARQVYLQARDDSRRRLAEYRESERDLLAEREEAYHLRRTRLQPECPICGQTLVRGDTVQPAGYYGETGSAGAAAFLEEKCFTDLVFRYFYRAPGAPAADRSLRELFRDSAQRCYFALRRAPHTRNFCRPRLSLYRFDEEGLEVSRKDIELPDPPRIREEGDLFPLLERTLWRSDRLGDDFFLVRPVGSDFPEEILLPETHRDFRRIADKVAEQLAKV